MLRAVGVVVWLVYFVAAVSAWSFDNAVLAVGSKGVDAKSSFS
jgi:hypothetical protein